MYRKGLHLDEPIHLFLFGGIGIRNAFTLKAHCTKFPMYNEELSLDLEKIKVLVIVFINKA